jgi:hypothetical protein
MDPGIDKTLLELLKVNFGARMPYCKIKQAILKLPFCS